MHLVDAKALGGLLGTWSTGADPLNEQLATAISHAIEVGELEPGARLPSERDLALQLGLSRTTIVGAYDRLRSSGLIRSRQGSGTRVGPRSTSRPLATTYAGSGPIEPYIVPDVAGDAILLTVGALRGWSGIVDAVRDTLREDLAGVVTDFGYLPFGLPSLRTAVARHLGAIGLPTAPEEVLITSGSQQGLHLLVDHLAGPEGVIAIEDPTYIVGVDLLRAVGTRMVSVPVGAEGMRLDALRGVLAGASPSFVYVVPTYHNPTGAVMPEAARIELARLAEARGVIIVEDLTPDLGVGARVPPPIGSFGRLDRIITVGSLSKVGWAGLRIGWIRAERPLITRLASRKLVMDGGSSLLSQAVAARILGRVAAFGEYAEREASMRRVVAGKALTRLLPDWEWTMPVGGLSFWVRLPNADAAAFARLAAEHGVIVRPGPFASPQGGFRDHIRIAVGEDPGRLVEGIERLARAWAEYQPTEPRSAATLAISV